MKLTDKFKMSEWAYDQCKNGNDIEEIRSLINSPGWCYNYCIYVKNRRCMREKVNVEGFEFFYRILCNKELYEDEKSNDSA